MGYQWNSQNNGNVKQAGYDANNVCDVDHERACLLQGKDAKTSSAVASERKTPIPSRSRQIVVLLCCVLLHLICNGIGYGLSIMYAEIIIVFNAPRAQAALIQGLYMGFSTGAGILFVGVIKKLGPGCSVMLGSATCCIGLAASGFSPNVTSIILLTGCLAAIGMCLCYLGAFLTVSWIFYKDPGVYLTCVTVGTSVGQIVIPVFYEMFIRDYSWSGAFILIAGISLQGFPLGLIIHCSSRYLHKPEKESNASTKRSGCDVTLFKDGVIWIMLIDFLLVSLTGNVEAWFIVDFMISRGFSRESGSTLVSMIGIANLIGRLSGTAIRFKCTKYPTIYHWMYLFPIVAFVHATVINVYDFGSILAICMVYGLSYGTTSAQVPAIMYEATGLERYPQGIAMVNVMFGVGNVLSNLLGGFIMDTFGKYDPAFYIASGTSIYITIGSAVVAFFIRRRNKRPSMTSSITVDSDVKYKTFD